MAEQVLPKVSCRVTAAILRFAETQGLIAAGLCENLPLTAAQLTDNRGWVDHNIAQALWVRLAAATGNPEIAAEVGLFAVRENTLGAVGTILRLFGTTSRVLQRTEHLTDYFADFMKLTPLRIGTSSALLELRTSLNVHPTYHNLNFVKGILVGIPLLWDLPMAKVEITRFEANIAECSPIGNRQYAMAPDGEVFSHPVDDPAARRAEGRLTEEGSFVLGEITYGASHTLYHITWEQIPTHWWQQPVFTRKDMLADTVAALEKDLREMESMYAQMQELHVPLQEKVDLRTAELEKANQELGELAAKLERQSRLKSEFIADLSHELRTISSSVAGFADLLSSEIYGALNERQKNAAERISSNTRVLLHIIDDLLDLSKLQAGKLKVFYEPVTVRDAVTETLETIRQLAESKGLKLHTQLDPETPARFICDKTKLKNILINLLTNAVKFTSRGHVVVRVSSPNPSVIAFSIEDTGPGIDPMELPMLFQEFGQIGRTNTTAGYPGLGLRVVKKLVDLLRGTIEVGSQPKIGSVFTVTLPVKPAGVVEEPEAEPESLDAQRNKKTVVVADSNPEEARFLQLSLESEGLHAIACSDGREVLKEITDNQADLLLLDPLLPHLDGWKVLHDLRANPATEKLPVILVSENIQEELTALYHVSSRFAKPYEKKRLIEEVLQILAISTDVKKA